MKRSYRDVKYFHILQYFVDIEHSSLYILLFSIAPFIIDTIAVIFIITSLEWSRNCWRTTIVHSFYLDCRSSFLVNLANIASHKYSHASVPTKELETKDAEILEQDVETVAR